MIINVIGHEPMKSYILLCKPHEQTYSLQLSDSVCLWVKRKYCKNGKLGKTDTRKTGTVCNSGNIQILIHESFSTHRAVNEPERRTNPTAPAATEDRLSRI